MLYISTPALIFIDIDILISSHHHALLIIATGMCTGMIYNLVRKLTEDKEDILASREKSLASLAMAESFPDLPR